MIGSVAPQHIGKASGTLSTMRQLGRVFGVAALGTVFAITGSYATALAFSHGFVAAISASGALAFAGALAGVTLPSRHASSSRLSTPLAPAIDVYAQG